MTTDRRAELERLLASRPRVVRAWRDAHVYRAILEQGITPTDLAARLDATVERLNAQGFRVSQVLLSRGGQRLYALSHRRSYGPPKHRIAAHPGYKWVTGVDVDKVMFWGRQRGRMHREAHYLGPVEFTFDERALYETLRENGMPPHVDEDAVRILAAPDGTKTR